MVIALAAVAGCKDSGSGTSDGAAGTTGAAACPSAPPAAGESCSGQDCFYEACSGGRRTVALCRNGVWVIDGSACGFTNCNGADGGNLTCQTGQICLQRAGGVEPMCVRNDCDGGPIACGCLQGCTGTCTVGGSATSGVRVSCP